MSISHKKAKIKVNALIFVRYADHCRALSKDFSILQKFNTKSNAFRRKILRVKIDVIIFETTYIVYI